MSPKERQERAGRVVFGLLLIGVGVIFTLDNMGRLEAGRLWQYWPLMLLGFGLTTLIAPKDSGDASWGALLTGLGSFFMLRHFHLIRWSFWQVWPLLLVLVGLVLLSEGWWAPRKAPDGKSAAQNEGGR
jgi:cell wall-active antibiotic response 4TMS protein YvqF